MSGAMPEGPEWDDDRSYEAALSRIIRADRRGTGCHLTPKMVVSLLFSEGDGEYFTALNEALYPSGEDAS